MHNNRQGAIETFKKVTFPYIDGLRIEKESEKSEEELEKIKNDLKEFIECI